MAASVILNDEAVSLEGHDPTDTLLDWLRARGMTGTKEGCAEGECGACAVALLRSGPDGRPRYDAVNACLVPLGAVAGHEVVTVEGVGSRERPHPVQLALARGGGSQCGYCTPGFVVSMFAEYYRPGRVPQRADPEAISGNLCRCTGYRPILDALASLAAPAEDDARRARLAGDAPDPGGCDWSADGSRFARPTSLVAALALLREHPGARPIAGGSDLFVERNLRGARFPLLVSLAAIPELRRLEWHADRVEIGAALTLRELEAHLAGRLPLLEQVLPLFASRLIRNAATLGGNLATASPIGDAAPVLLALDARVVVAGQRGERSLPLDGFFTGYRRTALEPGELIVSVVVPLPVPGIARFYKVSKRELDDIATVAAGFAIDLDAAGRVRVARLAYGGVAATPARAREAESAMVGRRWGPEAVAAARPALDAAFRPLDDQRGSARYRSAMVVRLLEKLCAETATGAARRLGA
jgi:xanthine dehydrogenase small subunit